MIVKPKREMEGKRFPSPKISQAALFPSSFNFLLLSFSTQALSLMPHYQNYLNLEDPQSLKLFECVRGQTRKKQRSEWMRKILCKIL